MFILMQEVMNLQQRFIIIGDAMNIYGLLKCGESTEPEVIGNEYLRLSKCYEFVLQESTDTDVRSIVEEKFETVKGLEEQAPAPNPGVYSMEKGIQPLYLEAIKMFDRFSNIETFNAAINRITEAYNEEPNSVMNKYLYDAMAEVVKYINDNPGAI